MLRSAAGASRSTVASCVVYFSPLLVGQLAQGAPVRVHTGMGKASSTDVVSPWTSEKIAESDDAPHVVERLQGLPVYAAFTDWDALRLWEPRGWPYRVIAGHQLFPLADDQRIASLMINPRGDIGGELLMNELRGLAAAARRRRD